MKLSNCTYMPALDKERQRTCLKAVSAVQCIYVLHLFIIKYCWNQVSHCVERTVK